MSYRRRSPAVEGESAIVATTSPELRLIGLTQPRETEARLEVEGDRLVAGGREIPLERVDSLFFRGRSREDAQLVVALFGGDEVVVPFSADMVVVAAPVADAVAGTAVRPVRGRLRVAERPAPAPPAPAPVATPAPPPPAPEFRPAPPSGAAWQGGHAERRGGPKRLIPAAAVAVAALTALGFTVKATLQHHPKAAPAASSPAPAPSISRAGVVQPSLSPSPAPAPSPSHSPHPRPSPTHRPRHQVKPSPSHAAPAPPPPQPSPAPQPSPSPRPRPSPSHSPKPSPPPPKPSVSPSVPAPSPSISIG